MQDKLYYCRQAEPEYFQSWDVFKRWLEQDQCKEFREIRSFTSNPVYFMGNGDETLNRLFRVAEVYQSGAIHYVRR
jgi:hypothetical protein